MTQTIDAIARLSAQLAKLPGIGSKTAQRLAYHLLGVPKLQAMELAQAITSAVETVKRCPVCGGYTDKELCSYCADTSRFASTICVVQEARDITSMERSREFCGRYHVLNGALSPMDGIGPEDIRIKELLERVAIGGVEEVILATNPDVEGEATATYIAKLLRDYNIKVTRIAHGIPIGGNLEYIDGVTLAKALTGRLEI